MHLLLNVTESGNKFNGLAILLGDHWYDLSSFLSLSLPSLDELDSDTAAYTEEENLSNLTILISALKDLVFEIISNKVDDKLAETDHKISESIDKAGVVIDAIKEQGSESEEVQESDKVEKILDFVQKGLNVAGSLLSGEEDQDYFEELFARPTESVYLPTAGLEKVQLITDEE